MSYWNETLILCPEVESLLLDAFKEENVNSIEKDYKDDYKAVSKNGFILYFHCYEFIDPIEIFFPRSWKINTLYYSKTGKTYKIDTELSVFKHGKLRKLLNGLRRRNLRSEAHEREETRREEEEASRKNIEEILSHAS